MKKRAVFLSGKKCILSPASKADLGFVENLINSDDIRKNLAERFPRNQEAILETIQSMNRKKEIFLIISDKKSGERAGAILLHDFSWHNRRTMLTISISPEFQGKGFGYESSKLLIDYAFKNLQVHKVCLEVYAFNRKAVSMYKKLGFKLEGRFKKHSFKDGKYVDLLFMSLISKDE
ncbi:MAG: GNAT family N-acetyltransferase [bacterium]